MRAPCGPRRSVLTIEPMRPWQEAALGITVSFSLIALLVLGNILVLSRHELEECRARVVTTTERLQR